MKHAKTFSICIWVCICVCVCICVWICHRISATRWLQGSPQAGPYQAWRQVPQSEQGCGYCCFRVGTNSYPEKSALINPKSHCFTDSLNKDMKTCWHPPTPIRPIGTSIKRNKQPTKVLSSFAKLGLIQITTKVGSSPRRWPPWPTWDTWWPTRQGRWGRARLGSPGTTCPWLWDRKLTKFGIHIICTRFI